MIRWVPLAWLLACSAACVGPTPASEPETPTAETPAKPSDRDPPGEGAPPPEAPDEPPAPGKKPADPPTPPEQPEVPPLPPEQPSEGTATDDGGLEDAWEDLSIPDAIERLPGRRHPRPTRPAAWRRHPLLRRAVLIVAPEAGGRIPEVERYLVWEEERLYRVMGPAGLLPFLREIRSRKDAKAMFRLLRKLLWPGGSCSIRLGTVLRPVRTPMICRGEYGPAEAKRWGVSFQPKILKKKGFFHVTRPVLVLGEGPSRGRASSQKTGWRVVLMEERVDRNGVYSFRVHKVLDPAGSRYQISRL